MENLRPRRMKSLHGKKKNPLVLITDLILLGTDDTNLEQIPSVCPTSTPT